MVNNCAGRGGGGANLWRARCRNTGPDASRRKNPPRRPIRQQRAKKRNGTTDAGVSLARKTVAGRAGLQEPLVVPAIGPARHPGDAAFKVVPDFMDPEPEHVLNELKYMLVGDLSTAT
jgi:hypothetical protein